MCAGSTPLFSGGRRAMPKLPGDDDEALPPGSPATVSRKLLQPVLLDTLRSLRSRSALGLGAGTTSGAAAGHAAACPAIAPTPGAQAIVQMTGLAGMPSGNIKAKEAGQALQGSAEGVPQATESGASDQGVLAQQER